jgi:uncharacterized delta-60 repeat protein
MRTFIAALALIALLAALGGTSSPIRAANGDLDCSFGGYGTNGRVIGDSFPGTQIADALALPDDKLLVVGSNGQDFVISRYDASGKLDGSFGNTGVTTLDFNNHVDFATAVALSYDGAKILVASTTSFGIRALPNADFALARLNADSTPDTTFSLACAPECNHDFGLARLTDDGGLDSSFGNGGKVQNDFGGDDTPTRVVFSSNTIFAAGYRIIGTISEYVVALYGYGNGALDTRFNGTGYRTGATPPKATDLLTVGNFAEEDLIVIGGAGGDFGLLRLNNDGSPVTAWGNGGLLTVDFGADDTPYMISYLPGSTIAVAGASGKRLAMARVTEQGQIVPDSAVTADFTDTGAETVRALALTLVPDVRLWTIGTITSGGSPRLVMMRHFLDGTADDGGRQTTDFGVDPVERIHNDDRAQAAVFQPRRQAARRRIHAAVRWPTKRCSGTLQPRRQPRPIVRRRWQADHRLRQCRSATQRRSSARRRDRGGWRQHEQRRSICALSPGRLARSVLRRRRQAASADHRSRCSPCTRCFRCRHHSCALRRVRESRAGGAAYPRRQARY